MNISELTEKVMLDFANSGGYSEIDEKELYKIIYKHLEKIYDEEVAVLTLKVDIDKASGKYLSIDQYKRDINRIKDVLNREVRKLCGKSLDQNLINP